MEPIDILERSVEVHGGLESWDQLKSISFTKKTILYNEDASVKRESVQNQKFVFGSNPSAFINSVLDSIIYQLVDDTVTIDFADSVFVAQGVEQDRLKAMFSSALYVTSQPFGLLKSGAIFTRELDTVIGKKEVFAIRISYPDDQSDSDQWTYYFDQKDFRVRACKVRHNQRVSLIENTSYDLSTPFLFNATRKSTILEKGRAKFVIAQYEYSNYKVEKK